MPSPLSTTRLELQRDRLQTLIERTTAVRYEPVTLGDTQLNFARVADPDAVLDAVCEQESQQAKLPPGERKELYMPYWAAAWESAVALAEKLASQTLAGHAVLDLGCGTGLVGTLAAAKGARVMLADYVRESLWFARLNTLPWRSTARVRQIDWRSDRLPDRFDLIAGADIIYERSQWELIEPFLSHHLASGGRVMIAEPTRPSAETFIEWITARGWAVEQSSVGVEGKSIRQMVLTR